MSVNEGEGYTSSFDLIIGGWICLLLVAGNNLEILGGEWRVLHSSEAGMVAASHSDLGIVLVCFWHQMCGGVAGRSSAMLGLDSG